MIVTKTERYSESLLHFSVGFYGTINGCCHLSQSLQLVAYFHADYVEQAIGRGLHFHLNY